MTAALLGYCYVQGAYTLTIRPRNNWIVTTYFTNVAAQANQGYRYLDYHYFGGKESGKYPTFRSSRETAAKGN
jgi:hypothetical protein